MRNDPATGFNQPDPSFMLQEKIMSRLVPENGSGYSFILS